MRDYKVLPQVLIAIAANGGSIMNGMSLGWSAPAGPRILDSSNAFAVSEREFSVAVSAMPFGAAISCVLSGIIRNKYGTRFTVLLFCFLNLLGWLTLIFAWNSIMLIIGRLFTGFSTGALAFNLPVYIGEFSSKEIRGILLTLYQVFVKSGVVFVYTLGHFCNVLTMNVISASILVCYAISFIFMPETPTFLVRHQKYDKAEKAVKILRGSQYNAKSEIFELQRFHELAAKAPKSSFIIEMKKKSTQKAFIIIVFMFFFFQMTGINSIVFYTTTIFIEADISLEASIASIILGIIQVLMSMTTMLFIDKFGRVLLLKISFAIMTVGQAGIGTFFLLKEHEVAFLDHLGWLPLTSLSIFSIGFASGMATIPFILLGEIFSDEAKKIVAPFAQTMNFVTSSAIGFLFPILFKNIGAGCTFYIFAGSCLLGLIFTTFFLPETKGKSLAEIQSMLEK